jgi:hypothetical protein
MAGLTRGAVLLRAAGLLVLGALTLAILRRGLAPPSGGVLGFVHGIDLVFHEAGHLIFGIFGRFIGALGGSLNQVLIPAICTGAFLAQGQRAAAAVALFWTGESIADVAVYVADGRDMKLPLLAEGLTHDWNWILSQLSLRDHAEPLGRVVFVLAALVLVASLALLALDLLRVIGTSSPGVVSSAATPDRKAR